MAFTPCPAVIGELVSATAEPNVWRQVRVIKQSDSLEDDGMDRGMIAVCGLDCESCPIRLAPTDPAAARVVIDWFKREGWLSDGEGIAQVIKRKMYCAGCLGDRDTHWSSDCWILDCCVDQRGHRNCSECEEFACDRLVDWAKQSEAYSAALARLREL